MTIHKVLKYTQKYCLYPQNHSNFTHNYGEYTQVHIFDQWKHLKKWLRILSHLNPKPFQFRQSYRDFVSLMINLKPYGAKKYRSLSLQASNFSHYWVVVDRNLSRLALKLSIPVLYQFASIYTSASCWKYWWTGRKSSSANIVKILYMPWRMCPCSSGGTIMARRADGTWIEPSQCIH